MERIDLPQQRVYGADGAVFPLALSPTAATAETRPYLTNWLATHRDELDGLLLTHRAVLFRGFGLVDHHDFHEFVEATGYTSMPYIGGAAVRTQLTSRVFTANESPSTEKIPFHHEMAQTPSPPTHIMFFCEVPPNEGGQTPLLISSEICSHARSLHPIAMEKISQGVRYVRVMSKEDDPTSAIGRGWKSTFNCENREDAEAALIQLGSTWEWLAEDNLKTITAVVPAVRAVNGSETFFNSIIAAYTGWNDSRNDGRKAVVTADGEYLDEQFMEDTARLMDELCVAIPWQAGDVMLIDNRTVMHSRRPFEGPRRILAAIARDAVR